MTSTALTTVDRALLPGLTDHNPFDDVTDPRHLRGAIEALDSLMDVLDRDDGPAADDTGAALSRAVGIRAAHGVARQHRQHAVEQFARLTAGRVRRPVVLDPTVLPAPAVLSRQGQPLLPMITSSTAPTGGLSSAQVWMPPGHRSFAHTHHHTGVGVLVLTGTAITLWWDEAGELHELCQRAGQHLYIPPQVPHAAINPYPVPVVAVEFRDNPRFAADNHLLGHLDQQVMTRLDPATAG